MTSDYKKKYTDLVSYLPRTYRSVANTSLLRNLHNKFLTKEEAVPMLGYIGDVLPNDNAPYVSAANLDREINSLVPSIYTKLGSEEYVFTFADVLQKLSLLGIDTDDFGTWGAATSYNLVPPIDLDKFSNYSRYRWYGHMVGVSNAFNPNMDAEYYVIQRGGVSDWSTGNYWVHENDANAFFAAQGYAFTIDNTVQALRPIIEYQVELEAEMVLHIEDGRPSATGHIVDQTVVGYKTEFCQKPLFNLYLQDGSHSGFVSPIFYYAEGNQFAVDRALKARIQTNAYGDFSFEQGLVSKDGLRILFYKTNDDLKSIWKKGQIEAPVYYTKDSNGVLVATDPATDLERVGAWKFPGQMFYNTTHENRKVIGYGDLLGHFTDIIAKQPGIVGNPYGDNNFRALPTHDFGVGGRIKDYGTDFSLFLGLTNQLDNSVPSIIEFGKLQYAQMLGAIHEYVSKNFGDFITTGNIPPAHLGDESDHDLQLMYNEFLSFVTTRNDASVFSDTTSSIAGWPATLPYLGLAPVANPTIYFDKTLGSLVLVHHDGHLSTVSLDDQVLDKNIASISYLRSDGQTTPGVVGYLPPSRPYMNQFWFDANTNSLKAYVVASDSSEKFPGVDGEYFYNRGADKLFQFDIIANTYVEVADKSLPWTEVNPAVTIAQLTLMIEQQLYNGCPSEESKIDADADIAAGGAKAQIYLEHEFAVFAGKHNLDISAGDYNPSDAFTWNYKNASIPGLTPGAARWFTLYQQYFGTERPNMEPWVLQGYSSQPHFWAALYQDVSGTRMWSTQMWSDIKDDTTPGFPAPNGPWAGKLAVDVDTDNLLPPYVSSSLPQSVEALTTTIPSGISDGYVFGELGPTELAWRVSVDCAYDKLKVCYEVNPIHFVFETWGYNNTEVEGYAVDRHEHRKVSHKDFVLHGETPTPKFSGWSVSGIHREVTDTNSTWTLTCVGNTAVGGIFSLEGNVDGVVSRSIRSGVEFIDSRIRFTVSDMASDFNIGDKLVIATPSLNVTYVPTKYAKFLGLNQWYVNLNRYNSVDMSIALSNNILRDWEMKLGHRMSGLINTELFEVKSDQFALHSNDYEILIKENKNVASFWLNALRIQLIRAGTSEFVNGKRVPANKGADWVFRIETFNTHNPSIQYYEYDPAGKYQTFYAYERANSQDQWINLKDRTQLVSKLTPFVVTGIENVANVVFGYVDKLHEDGWRFNQGDDPQVDIVSGRVINWQMHIERFINQQYLGVEAGSGVILNPFTNAVWFATPHGFVANLRNPTTSDITSAQSVFDSFGNAIHNADIQIFRNDDVTQIQSAIVIGGIHLLLDEYEHIALFNNYTSDKTRQKLVYDPYLGVRVNRLYVTAERQSAFNGRLSFGGHYIQNHKVKRNIEASITDMLNYYDADKMLDKSATSKYARGLLGYDPKQYMADIELTDKSQFGFWRGLISNKGSNLSVSAFLNSARFESAKIDEYWAYKLATYGDARQLSFPEIKLSTIDAQHNYTKIQFVADDAPGSNGFINIHPSDEARWVSVEDQSSDLNFAAEMIGEVPFEGIWPGVILDLELNGKKIIADSVQVFEQVFLKTGDMSPFWIRVQNFNLINASTIQFTSAATVDLNTYALSAPRKFIVKCFGPSQPKFNPAKLIDYKSKVIMSDLALWDPARGAHTAEALDVVDMISPDDPSKYNYSVRTVNNFSYDPYRPWDNKDVGRVWWNTKNMEYIPYSDVNVFPSIDTRLSYWGSLADWATIELYEWTESSVHPSKYQTLVDAQESDSSIPAELRASGNVAVSELYSRNRTWRQRPVAWGYTDAPGSVVPYLSSVGEARVAFRSDLSGNTMAILSTGNWVSSFDSLVIGTKVSGGVFHYNVDDVSDPDNFKLTKPYGEAIVSGLNQEAVVGSSISFDSAVFAPPVYTF